VVGDHELAFSVLGSGSGGNCVVVRAAGTTVLVDAGLNLKETTARLELLGLDAREVDGILLTHEHGDHVAHASTIARRLEVPLYANDGTRRASARFLRGDESFELFETGKTFAIGALEVTPVRKPHDAADPVAYLIRSGDGVVGVLTDVGHVDAVLAEAIGRCTALVMESNHDPDMLARGPYPAALKARVGGRLGHISNDDGARAVSAHRGPALKVVVLAHISTTNNSPAHVKAASLRHLGAAPGFDRWFSTQTRPTWLLSAGGRRLAPPAAGVLAAAPPGRAG
jgi:phosphoribosyl 1,2-cyclic phosphodiesterase